MFQIVDAALGGSSGDDEEEEEEKPYGHKTAEFLFSFGATCLERSVVLSALRPMSGYDVLNLRPTPGRKHLNEKVH